MDFPNQRIYVPVAKLFGISNLAIGAEIADALTEWNMNIQSKVFAICKRQMLVIFIFEGEGLDRFGQPHSCQIRNDTHSSPKCTSDMSEAFKI